MPIQYIWAHRQSNKDRGRDPGEEIWKRVVLQYAVPVLGLEIQPEFKIGDGRTIPPHWMDIPIPEYRPSSLGRNIGIALGITGLVTSVAFAGYAVYQGTRRTP
jgi:hypothetical protein